MLGKLVKYELRATRRTMLPLYAALLVISFLTRLSTSYLSSRDHLANDGFAGLIAVILATLFVFLMLAVGFITIFLMAQRFQKNLLGDEGYISFTLPVTPGQNITAKLIVSIIWSFASILADILAVMILTVQADFFRNLMELMRMLLEELTARYAMHTTLWTLEGILLCVISMAASILVVYASIAVGHCFQKHRIFMSFVAFLGFLVASQFATYLLANIMMHIPMPNFDFIGSVHALLLSSALGTGIYGGIFFCITNYTLTNRLNLE